MTYYGPGVLLLLIGLLVWLLTTADAVGIVLIVIGLVLLVWAAVTRRPRRRPTRGI